MKIVEASWLQYCETVNETNAEDAIQKLRHSSIADELDVHAETLMGCPFAAMLSVCGGDGSLSSEEHDGTGAALRSSTSVVSIVVLFVLILSFLLAQFGWR